MVRWFTARPMVVLLAPAIAAVVLLTTAIGTAGAVTTAAGPSAAASTTPDLDAARAGLAAYLDDHRPPTPQTSTDIAGCPALDVGRLDGALAAVGLEGGLADWGTEIEWDEYESIDADLLGIACGGDTDGDSHDSDVELYAGINVVDAGTEDRAQEVLALAGFGTLAGEPADVPGGELFAVCLDEDELGAVCMSFWSFDGFVVGVAVASSVQEVPEGTSTLVLEDVLAEVLANLAAYGDSASPPAETAPADGPASGPASGPSATAGDVSATSDDAPGGLDIDGARTALASLTSAIDPVGQNEPLRDCPIVGRDAVVDALTTAGIDSPIVTLDQIGGPTLSDHATWQAQGVVCGGAYVGSTGDESFPETRVEVAAAVFDDVADLDEYLAESHAGLDRTDTLPTPTIGGETFGECSDVDRHTRCAEYWVQDGFMVAVQISDRVYVDRPTASAVLAGLLPAVVDTLVAAPVPEQPTALTATGEQVAQARSGLASVMAAEAFAPCPLVDQAAVDSAVAAAGVDLDAGRLDDGVPLEARAEPLGLACPTGDWLEVIAQDLGDSASAQELIDLVHGCQRVGDVEYCVESWEQDGLVISVSTNGPDLDRAEVVRLLEAVVPAVLAQLGAVQSVEIS